MRVRLPLTVLSGVLAALVLAGPSSADEGPQRQGTWYPGLPYAECRPIAWDPGTCEGTPNVQEDYTGMNVMQTGMTGSVASKQWARVPIALLAANSGFTVGPNDKGGNDSTIDVWAHFVSPKGSRDNYGHSPLIPVRTVAFGSIPATVVLQVDQKRDSADLPLPFYLHIENYSTDEPAEYYPSVKFTATVDVSVRSVTVDGVDTRLTGPCHAVSSRIAASSRPARFVGDNPPRSITEFDPATQFVGLQGGQLDGTIDVPAFTGCTTSTGDDLSRLLTATVSGSTNPISLRLGSLNCQFYEGDTGRSIPPAPGTSPKTLGPTCPVYEPFLPNPKIQPVPGQLPFPTVAPSAR